MQGTRQVPQALLSGVLSASLAAMLVAAPLTGVQRAQANPASTTGTIIITAQSFNEGVTYDAWQIFTGTTIEGTREVTADDGTTTTETVKRIEDVQWASSAMRTTVVQVIQAHYDGDESSYTDPTDASTSAQRAAEFIAEHIGDEDGTASGTFPGSSDVIQAESGTFAMDLALAVSALDATTTIMPGVATTLANGWWLVATDSSSLTDQGSTGTSPLLVTIGASDVEITEKVTTAPEPVKRAYEDSTKAWAYAVDTNCYQVTDYRIDVALPDNWKSYATYYLKFTDTFVNGFILNDVGTYSVSYVDEDGAEEDVSDYFSFKWSSSQDTITATCTDVLKFYDNGGTITLYYQAYITEEAVTGAEGNSNGVTVTYSNNPLHPGQESTSTYEPPEVTTYTYQITIHKQDKQDPSRSLAGAKFTLQVASGNSDAASVGKYVQADGSLADEVYKFESDEDGDIVIPRIDEGTYTLTETDVPDAIDDSVYRAISPTTIVITTNIEEVGEDVTGGTALTLDAVSSDGEVIVTDMDADSGVIAITVTDAKQTLLPKTGSTIALMLLAAGLAMLAAGAARAASRRRKADAVL